jgi:hypothetical protein
MVEKNRDTENLSDRILCVVLANVCRCVYIGRAVLAPRNPHRYRVLEQHTAEALLFSWKQCNIDSDQDLMDMALPVLCNSSSVPLVGSHSICPAELIAENSTPEKLILDVVSDDVFCDHTAVTLTPGSSSNMTFSITFSNVLVTRKPASLARSKKARSFSYSHGR